MKHILKRILVITLITHLALVSSVIYNAAYSYAVTEEDWESISTNSDLVESFRAYCKSRDLTIEGSMVDAITSFTSDTYYNLASRLGIDVTVLQSEIKKYTPDNLGTRWFLTSTGVAAYNRMFAQLLQDYELTEGQENVDEVVYSGEYFVDDDGNGCFVYDILAPSWGATGYGWGRDYANMRKRGSFLKYSPYDYVNMYDAGAGSVDFHVDNNTVTVPIIRYDFNGFTCTACEDYYPYYQQGTTEPGTGGYGGVTIIKASNFNGGGTVYTLGVVTEKYQIRYGANDNVFCDRIYYTFTGNTSVTDENVKIVSPQIGLPLPEADTQILPDGDTTDDPIPDDGPGGGSGGSGSGGTGSDTTIDVDLPNINLPDLGNIDWSLSGLSEKFPFCIPFDLYHFVDVLDAEPETPKFEGSINLIVTTWDLDYDLSAFDDLAAIVRNVEFIGFCIGLIFITRKIIKG